MKKLIISVLTVAAMFATTSSAFAEVTKYRPNDDGTFTVTYNVGADQKDAYCGVVAVKGTGILDLSDLTNIVYIDQAQVDESGNIAIENFGLRAVDTSNAADTAYEKSSLYIGGAGLSSATQIAVLSYVDEYIVSGAVKDTGFDSAVSGASVTVTATDGTEYVATTDSDGTYSVEVEAGEGYSVKYEKNAYCSFTYTGVDVEADVAIADLDMKDLAGDVVTAGGINANDLGQVLTDFGKVPPANPNSDINGGGVNANDLSAVLRNFGAKDKTVEYTN